MESPPVRLYTFLLHCNASAKLPPLFFVFFLFSFSHSLLCSISLCLRLLPFLLMTPHWCFSFILCLFPASLCDSCAWIYTFSPPFVSSLSVFAISYVAIQMSDEFLSKLLKWKMKNKLMCIY